MLNYMTHEEYHQIRMMGFQYDVEEQYFHHPIKGIIKRDNEQFLWLTRGVTRGIVTPRKTTRFIHLDKLIAQISVLGNP